MLELADLKLLEREFGSPLYIFHVNDFITNYNKLLNTFRAIYPKYNIAYSYKTNYTPRICKLVKELGGLAEVVSEMEYCLARKIGYEHRNIIFNGPVKGRALNEHLLNGGVINVDSLDELDKVCNLARTNPNNILRIAFRVNIDIGQGFVSRFGLDAYEDSFINSELDQAFNLVNKISNIKVVGIHCHVGRSRNIEAWQNRVRIMFTLVDRYFKEVPEFIDFGSGMNSIMEPELAKQFNGHIPSFEEYANVVATAMQDKYGSLPYEQQPFLYTEPGTTVVSGNMSFIGKIESIKNVKSKTYVTFNCSGGNMGDICHLKNLPITIFHDTGKIVLCNDASFVGYTCLEHDHIYEGYNGPLAVGDYVEFRNIGSYSNVFKPPFILPNCSMISEEMDGKYKMIKAPESFDDLFHTYKF